MRTTTRAWTPLALGLALGACGAPKSGGSSTVLVAPGPAAPEATPVQPIVTSSDLPAWTGWPADPAVLQAAIAARDTKLLREHGWRLWAGINQPLADHAPQPRWWTWPTTTQLFEAPVDVKDTAMLGHRHTARKRRLPASAAPTKVSAAAVNHTDECYAAGKAQIFFPSPTYAIPKATAERFGLDMRCTDASYFLANTSSCNLKDGTHFQSNGDIMVATESFSTQAAEAIQTLGYNQGATLRKLLDAGTPILPGLPPKFVDTKHMYWPVKAHGLSALPLYRDIERKQWCRYNGYETWATLAAIDPSGAVHGKGKVDFLFGVYDAAGKKPLPTRHAEADVFPLERFFAQRIDKSTWEAMDQKDQILLDAASQWAHGQPFEPDDYVITVAMHLTTKEIPQWTFQSFWWSDRPEDGAYAADRPPLPEASGPWRNYLMTIEYGISDEAKAGAGAPSLPIAFNPFIELAATHPVATNCRNCHMRAGVTTPSYLADPGPGPLADLKFDDAIFKGLLLTDTSWVIADRVTVPAAP